jgi:hypothetical protein
MLDATCSPGPNWAVGTRWYTPESPALLLYLDPESLAIQLPQAADGDVLLSQFLRKICYHAGQLATQLEARQATGTPPDELLSSDHDSR